MLVVLPRLAPGVTPSVVGCITGIVVVFGDPGLPLCRSQFSVEKVDNLSLTSDLSQLGRLSSRQVVGHSHSVVAEMVSYLFVHQYSQLVTPVSELDNQGAWLISATSAVDSVCLLNVGRCEGYCQLSCVIQNINYFLHTRFVRLLCCLWNADKFQIVFSQDQF